METEYCPVFRELAAASKAIHEITRNERTLCGRFRVGFVDRYIRLLNCPYVQREEFNIPIRPLNR